MRAKRGGRAHAQTAVEFALIAPIMLVLILGIPSVGWLAYVRVAVSDAARGAARAAIVQTSLYSLQASGTNAGLYCESGNISTTNPVTIEAQTQVYANIVPVNTNTLCQHNVALQQLSQTATSSQTLSITVIVPTGEGTLAAPDEVEIKTTYATDPFFDPFGILKIPTTFTFYSTLPTYAGVAS